MSVQNSFFSQDLYGKKVAIFCPHQDDEVHVGGGLLESFKSMGAEIYVVFSTNGDYKFKASTRYREVINALSVMGIDERKIVFMGYADGCIKDKHIFFAEYEPQVSLSGHVRAYGALGHSDYGFIKRGKHSPYTKKAFYQDIKDILCDIYPDIILCVDYDHHWDHRMLSVALDDVLGELLNSNGSTYAPLVYKTLAYANAYEAKPDFYDINILSVPRPLVGEVLGYDTDILEYSFYDWERRIRFPVPLNCRGRFLHTNLLFQALVKHHSQGAAMHAEYCINGDVVYWQRRTDNLLYSADIIATSGDPECIRDFCVYGVPSIKHSALEVGFKDKMWCPNEEDKEKSILISWDECKPVSQIVLYGNITAEGKVCRYSLNINGDEIIQGGPLPDNGRPQYIIFSEQKMIKSCRIVLEECWGNAGINQCEMFSDGVQHGGLRPHIKLMIDGEFAYDYWIDYDVNEVNFDCYSYMYDGDVHIEILNECNSKLLGNKLVIDDRDNEIYIRAVAADDDTIYDVIEIKRKKHCVMWKLRLKQMIEKRIINFCLRRIKKYMYLRNRYVRDI